MLSKLAIPGKWWYGFSRSRDSDNVSRKILSRSLAPVLKVWVSYYHHNFDTNISGSELTTLRALEIYYLLDNQPVNLGKIIAEDMDAIVQSKSKKVTGHAYVILLLCMKAGVEPLTDGIKVIPSKEIDTILIGKMNVVSKTEDANRQGEGNQLSDNVQRSDPLHEFPSGVTAAYHYHHSMDEESYAHRVEMHNSCRICA
ncbi:unnamed protein product [Vicia faba]|uniref:Uncharacterized protein n=1 Tax=Vicia faba TaxID=3906 RepID=A0AAV0ZI52_VICFA|nr:unnamed protein product [Vicia faba]